jgi:hypothetical protein
MISHVCLRVQSIMWCNQLVKAVAGALIELANLQAPGRVVPVDARMRLFGRQFLRCVLPFQPVSSSCCSV